MVLVCRALHCIHTIGGNFYVRCLSGLSDYVLKDTFGIDHSVFSIFSLRGVGTLFNFALEGGLSEFCGNGGGACASRLIWFTGCRRHRSSPCFFRR